jgi:hypothetical protein
MGVSWSVTGTKLIIRSPQKHKDIRSPQKHLHDIRNPQKHLHDIRSPQKHLHDHVGFPWGDLPISRCKFYHSHILSIA